MSEPGNSFLLFCKDYRSILLICNPTYSNCEVTALLAKKWKEISPELREDYRIKAYKLRREFQYNNPNYVRKSKNSKFQDLLFDFKVSSKSASPIHKQISVPLSTRKSEHFKSVSKVSSSPNVPYHGTINSKEVRNDYSYQDYPATYHPLNHPNTFVHIPHVNHTMYSQNNGLIHPYYNQSMSSYYNPSNFQNM
mmetsp:Transcript_31507/g.53913  ORF Transcript_31507/g.53913 Transcript_31507/m.53913 type:complete len:194 (-) Transcript_31507:39-620(-)